MHEVVTLQFGNRANYLATHFWNAQESYFTYPTPTDPTPKPSPVDHDINFRPGIGADGSDTYTPRTLLYDFQADFGGLRKLNALYDKSKPDEVIKGLWDGIQQTQTVPPIAPIPYQLNLESGLPTPQLQSTDVRYWSDFNRLFYHPRSIVPLSQQSVSSSLNATEVWSNGTDLYKETDLEVDILDRDVRPFAEECDSLSAFQIFSSVDDSWGGYAASYVEALREEYGKKSIWVWAVEDGRQAERTKKYQRLANSARTLRSIAQNASAYIRLSNTPSNLPEHVRLQPGSEWSTSALLCAAVESVTLPARLRNDSSNQPASITLFEDLLNTNSNQNVWTLEARARSSIERPSGAVDSYTAGQNGGMSQATDTRVQRLPSGNTHNPSINEDADIEPSSFDINFTPDLPTAHTALPSLVTKQAKTDNHIFSQIESHRYLSTTQMPLHTTQPTPNRIQQAINNSEPIVSIYNSPLAFPLLDSYPDTLFHVPTRNRKLLIDAALSTRSSTKREVLGLRDLVAGRTGRGLGLIEVDEVEGLYDDLTGFADAYDWGWEGSDEDEEED